MVLILMGVAGCGKTTVGTRLAERLRVPFFDADDFHSKENRARMAQGTPLTDADRAEWLQRLVQSIRVWNQEQPLTLLACSALKHSYREVLAQAGGVEWIYLAGNRDLIAQRLADRQGHFFNPTLLESQFQDLEAPTDIWTIDVTPPVEILVERIRQHLRELK
ncbi:MAG: gluconokinase [bacterium]